MIPTLSCLSVGISPASCLRYRRSGRYLCISPLHLPFRPPRDNPSHTVSKALHRLSLWVSPPTYLAAYAPFKPNKSGQRLHPPYYRGCCTELAGAYSGGTLNYQRIGFLSPPKSSLQPRGHSSCKAWLGQACAHCPIFPTAASRRSLARVSVPVWGISLSGPLTIVALVGHYPAN